MQQRIMEILVFLMGEIEGRDWKADQMDRMSEDLASRGYTEQEINTAFYWLYRRFGWDTSTQTCTLDVHDPAESSHRVLHTLEQSYIAPEAFGFLLQLRHLKLVTSREMEEIIERLLFLDLQPAGVDEVRAIVQAMLFEDHGLWAGSFRSAGPLNKGETYH